MADIISSFPDSILCYILSFLPTKQVVTTSVLSKRWKLLWRSVPSLDFHLRAPDMDYMNYESRKLFLSSLLFSVYNFLLFREMEQPIHRLRFTSRGFHNFESIERCIKTALRISGRLEHLHINLDWVVELPSTVFTCKTLVVLELIMPPKKFSFVDLPLLKILHLRYVPSFECEDLQRFLSGCPNLEDLEVGSSLAEKSASNTAEKFHKLPKLIRANIHTDLVSLGFVKNVEVLVTDRIYKEDLGFDFQNLLQLELTRLELSTKWFEVLESLKHCPKLQALVIDIDEGREALLPCPDPVPTCISLHLRTCRLNNFRGSVVELQFAEFIMKNAHYLRTMKFCFPNYYAFDSLTRGELTRYISSCMKKSSDTCMLSFE
ncbi:hypothetical protein PHAVU_004G096100 [Phaseolus vulgaris]|uniref:F-box domain-containing protein n=1 Tax=Phaseolus vulgaris TaxID=3885 RepID=V7C3S7_PHAVU|nr:hypothetical protein PHAVU_004G096100g [Phaseolus vulgaris]ESW24028.1 hypothetical protein PHAVU_004G096100g [Phaseolus vulgaris]